jgi:magnesium-transporting ATPase (P-type)
VFVTAQFWFSYFTGWSGQKFYVEYGTQTFNLLYTSLPVLVMGIYDRDVDAEYALRFPKLYDHGRLALGLNVRVFASWLVGALVEGAAIFWLVVAAWTAPGADGAAPYVFQLGTVAFSCVVAAVSVRAGAEMNNNHAVFSAVVAGSALLLVPAMFTFDAMNADGMRGGVARVYGAASFWLTLLLVLGVTGGRLMAWKAYKRLFAPELRHVVQEVQSITHDDTAVARYCDAADLARRTGRSVGEVLEAQALLDAGRAAVAAGKRAASAAAAVAAAGGGWRAGTGKAAPAESGIA